MEVDSLTSRRAAVAPGIPRCAWLAIPAGLLCALVLLIPTLVLRGQRLAPNVQIESLPVGGLTMTAAARKLQPTCERPPITILVGERPCAFTLNQLGGAPDWDATLGAAYRVGRDGNTIRQLLEVIGSLRSAHRFTMTYRYDLDKLRAALRRLAWTVNKPPVNATLRLEGDRLLVSPERSGIRLDVDATAAAIQHNYASRRATIPALIKVAPARIRRADLESVNAPLTAFHTWFKTSDGNRSNNIRLCAGSLNGCTLLPGDHFSFNERVGDRTPARGFRLAGMFVNGEKVQGYGGGVCQVSSTVFNAARTAGLQITERHPHSLPVPYVRKGQDATVVFPYSDLRFRNTSDTPLFLEATAKGGKMTVRLWGKSTSMIARSESTSRYIAVKYPDEKKAAAAREELGLPRLDDTTRTSLTSPVAEPAPTPPAATNG